MNAISEVEFNGSEEAVRISEGAALPEAPLAMPVQSLEVVGLVAWLRAVLGAGGRAVKH